MIQDTAILILRLALGIVFIRHGWPKIKNPTGMKGMVGAIPSTIVAIFEFFGALFVLFGFYTQIGAAAIAIVMLGAIYFHIFVWKHKFMNIGKDSWEHPFTLLLVAIALILLGSGAYSIDAMLA